MNLRESTLGNPRASTPGDLDLDRTRLLPAQETAAIGRLTLINDLRVLEGLLYERHPVRVIWIPYRVDPWPVPLANLHTLERLSWCPGGHRAEVLFIGLIDEAHAEHFRL